MRAVSVAKYQPPASSSARRAVGDHAPVGEQHRAIGTGGGELGVVRRDDHRLTLARARARSSLRELGLRLAVHAARGLIEREHGGRSTSARRARDDRERKALALAAGEVARVALGQRRQPDRCERLAPRPPRATRSWRK